MQLNIRLIICFILVMSLMAHAKASYSPVQLVVRHSYKQNTHKVIASHYLLTKFLYYRTSLNPPPPCAQRAETADSINSPSYQANIIVDIQLILYRYSWYNSLLFSLYLGTAGHAIIIDILHSRASFYKYQQIVRIRL